MNLNLPALPEPTDPELRWLQGLPQLPKIPPNRTLRWALGVIGATSVIQVVLICTAPPLEKEIKPKKVQLQPSTDAGNAGSPSMLIEPRLGAPTLRSAWQDLLEQSRTAGAKGEMETAIKLLELAEAQVPQQPAALAEIAVQMEKCAPPERALKLWQRVHQFGVSAGVYYAAADAKLSLLKAKSADASSAGTAPKRELSSESGPLRLGKLAGKELPGSLPERRFFTLSVPVKRTSPGQVQVKDVSIQVQFYDQINGRMLERTNAGIRWNWSSSPVDWRENPVETLDVEYRQAPARGEERRYFGYVASVYYQDKLVDSRADPVRLGQQYPPPRLLPRDNSQ